MKIIRDGKEYELTFSEMIQSYEEYRLDCMIEDVRSTYTQGEYDVELSDDDIEEVAISALHNLGKNDVYYDAFWTSVNYTLDDYINNMDKEKE